MNTNILITAFEEHKRTGKTLREELNKLIVKKLKGVAGFDPQSLYLQHIVYDRPITYMSLDQDNLLQFHNSKGYICRLNALPFEDLVKLLKEFAK